MEVLKEGQLVWCVFFGRWFRYPSVSCFGQKCLRSMNINKQMQHHSTSLNAAEYTCAHFRQSMWQCGSFFSKPWRVTECLRQAHTDTHTNVESCAGPLSCMCICPAEDPSCLKDVAYWNPVAHGNAHFSTGSAVLMRILLHPPLDMNTEGVERTGALPTDTEPLNRELYDGKTESTLE